MSRVTPVLQARGLSLGYARADGGTHWVLQDFSLDLAPGELVVLLGPSGVGKSSLLRVLAGLQAPQRGQTRLFGEPVHAPHPRVSFVFQDPCLLPWLTLEQNVGFGLDFARQPELDADERQRRVRAALAEVGLQEARQSYPAALSGGMAQRASLARGLARQPQVLLLDEPFSALDEVTRGAMQELLRALLARHGAAAVMVTHSIDEALNLADRVVLIGGQPGRLVDAWALDWPHPRDPTLPALAQMRQDIVRSLRGAHAVPAGAALAA